MNDQIDYGFDTSRWQGAITADILNQAEKAGKKFWYFKGTGGDNGLYVDGQFSNSLVLGRATTLRRGVFHFSGLTDAATEANYAYNNAWNQLQTGEVAILDVDTNTQADVPWTSEFLNTVIPLLGFTPVLYMNQNTENSLDWAPIVRMNVGLIIANYSIPPTGKVPLKYWPFYLGQQYSNSGTIGPLNPVDLDAIFVSDISVWDKYGKPAPATPAPGPAPTPQPAPAPTTYAVTGSMPGYTTAADALARQNSNSSVPVGTYSIFNKVDGMLNISRIAGEPGWWINPLQNQPTAPKKYITVQKGWGLSNIATAAGYADAGSPSRWAAIAALNGTENWEEFNAHLQPGQVVRVQ